MRHAMANRRRNRSSGGGGHQGHQGGHRPQQNKATVFDSNGPDVRIRGTAYQIVEKYLALAKDSAAAGDRVLAENYLQHAEHYQRLANSWAEENPQRTYSDAPADAANTAQPEVVVTRPERIQVNDDLSLPASILGMSPQEASETVSRAPERITAAG
jgi:hypothetical protein